ncbi:MAG: hypothetical protein HY908_22715 [Myxococcales bacterium]|nr:hypothetical protein [Myxococcales bacterium]
MDLAKLERDFSTAAAPVALCDPRVMRRIIRAHRDVSGLKLDVPHARCYALARDALKAIIDPAELGAAAAKPDKEIILVARPAPRELAGRTPGEVLQKLWRAAFHAGIHLELDRRFEGGNLSEALVRERIDRIGQIEFDEVRATLRHDDLVLPPGDDRQTYSEFVALYLELRFFAPHLLSVHFPGLHDAARIEAILAADVAAEPILGRCKPEGADPLPLPTRGRSATSFLPPPSLGLGRMFAPRPPSARRRARLRKAAAKAKAAGNDVRAALLRAVVGLEPDCEEERKAARQDLRDLGQRVNAALAPLEDAPLSAGDRKKLARGDVDWSALLTMLATEAAIHRGLRYPVEARLLYDLQLAAMSHEKPERAVDMARFLFTLGKQPMVRALPATREIRVARYIHAAQKKVRHARIDSPDRKLLGKALRAATERAELNVRLSLRPKLLAALDEVGLEPRSGPEQNARNKLVEELLDRAVENGFLMLGDLRDAISRNQLKLEDMRSARELWHGDALTKLDKILDVSLDGVYRKGEVYLRGLQRLSAPSFGTRIGRHVVLWGLLPAAIAFVVLEGATHIVGPLWHLFGGAELHLLDWRSFLLLTLFTLGLIHSSLFRWGVLAALSLVGKLLRFWVVQLPHWIITRRAVRWFLRTTVVRVAFRRVLLPAAIALPVYLLTPLRDESLWVAIAISVAVFVALSWIMSSRLAELAEDFFFDKVAPSWRALSHHLLPGLFRLVARFFAALMELLDRGMYKVDELLRFRQGQSKAMVWVKGGTGLVWGGFAYVVRLYITLLIEPYINPIKLPITTVAHKLFVPFTPGILAAFNQALSFLGPVIGGTIAGVTGFFLPSVFGFIVWELKENWKLYRASRSDKLAPVLVGNHGETVGALLVPGFHSGTLPKLYVRLRRAAQREDEDAARASRGPKTLGQAPHRSEGSRGQFREGLHEIETSVRRFVERELVALLAASRDWHHGPLALAGVDLGSNRMRLRLACPGVGPELCEVAFEEQSGLILASVAQPGFLDALDATGRIVFENALGGLYHLAGVDLVREQIAWAIGRDTPYDVIEEGLLVWPGTGYRTEVVYRFRGLGRSPMVKPKVRGEPIALAPAPLDRRKLVFKLQHVRWVDWVDAWSTELEATRAPERLVPGPSLLPPLPGESMQAPHRLTDGADLHTAPTPSPPAPGARPPAPAPAPTVAAGPAAVPTEPMVAPRAPSDVAPTLPAAVTEAVTSSGSAPTEASPRGSDAAPTLPGQERPRRADTEAASSAAPTVRR